MTLPLTEQDIDRLAGQGVRSLSPQDFNHLLAQAKLAIEIRKTLDSAESAILQQHAEMEQLRDIEDVE